MSAVGWVWRVRRLVVYILHRGQATVNGCNAWRDEGGGRSHGSLPIDLMLILNNIDLFGLPWWFCGI
jgi:hypothetical protein